MTGTKSTPISGPEQYRLERANAADLLRQLNAAFEAQPLTGSWSGVGDLAELAQRVGYALGSIAACDRFVPDDYYSLPESLRECRRCHREKPDHVR